MGAWGPGLLSNDTAGDLVVLWDDFIVPLHKNDPKIWSSERIADLFLGLRPFRPGAGVQKEDETAEVLALGALYLRHEWKVPSRLRQRLIDVANTELEDARLRQWPEPAKRRRALVGFLGRLGEKAKPREVVGGVPPSSLAQEIAQHKKFAPAIPKFLRVMKGSPSDEFNEVYPAFIDKLFDLFATPGNNPEPREWEAVKYRLMLCAWVLGGFLALGDEEILALIARAEATNGRLPLTIVSE
jgi:hypothetical protein